MDWLKVICLVIIVLRDLFKCFIEVGVFWNVNFFYLELEVLELKIVFCELFI